MKILRFAGENGPRIGVLQDDGIVPLDMLMAEYPTVLAIVAGGEPALADVRAAVADMSAQVALADVRLLAPIERPAKFLAIGMNYKKHLEEAKRLGVSAPQHQYWFNKQTSCIAGPFDDIDPGVTEKLDYEVELCAIIGKTAKGVSAANAKDYVFGYTICNDVTARDWQQHAPTFTVGKSFDTHGPIGPWIVTADEIADPHTLDLKCFVNGELRQSGNTGELIHNVWDQIEYLSTAFTLDPGDLLATGTPDGVGVARTPPVFMQPGDVVRCEVAQIGVIENKVVPPRTR